MGLVVTKQLFELVGTHSRYKRIIVSTHEKTAFI